MSYVMVNKQDEGWY